MDNEAPLRRLNGRLQACDQCRARKVACDHARPVCNRCIKRNQAGGCTYTVGSVLQPRRRARQQKTRLANNPLVQETSPSLSHQSERSRSGSGSERAARNATTNANVKSTAKANGSPGSGFFGFTSHAVVYEETKRSLSRLQGQASDTRLQRPGARGRTPPRLSFSDLPPIVRHMSIYALEALPGQANEQLVFYEKDPEEKRWSQIVLARITHSVQDLLRKSPDGSGPDLEKVAEILCNNSAQPLRDMDDPQQWMDQYCGDNLRWESIGLIWGNLERLTDTLNSLRPCHVAWIPGKTDRELSRTHLAYCIDLARQFTDGNAILLDLIRRQTTFISHLDGDAAASCWYSHGAAVSMLTFMGLHAQVGEIPHTPTLCSEHNRRIVAQIYNHDKFSVAFSGRPALLNRRYCMTPLPLDLRDEDLADEATLQKAAQELDERGWNKAGKMYPFTLIRARRMMASILEEVMELALGCTVCTTLDELRCVGEIPVPTHSEEQNEWLTALCRNIQVRQLETLAGFPACLKYDPQDLSDPNRDIESVYAKILIRLGHLQVMFFLERLLCINGSLEEGNLLVLSVEMLTLTLTLWTHKDQFAAMRRNFEWLLMAHAAPAGGILCLELLNPSFTGKHPKEERITRSSIIQNLSLLVGFLDWVRPSAPNGDLCMDCKVIIQRVLDHTLNGSLNGDSPWAALAYDFPEPLDFNFDLLDTFDWLHTDFQ